MYRINLQHQHLTSCDGNCFDDLCCNCRNEIISSADETDIESANNLHMPSNLLLNDNYTTDESELNTSSEEEIENDQPKDEDHEELNRKSQKVSRCIQQIHEHFLEFSNTLNRQDRIISQLLRQHNHCNELLSTFEDFLVSFEEETESHIYCGNWFAQVLLLKEHLSHFDHNAELLIRHINNKMEILFDQFIERKHQLIADQSLTNLKNVLNDLRCMNNCISSADNELDDIVDYIAVQVQEQRNLIGSFVEVMSAISRAVESTIVCNDIAEFDCFNGQQFLQEFDRTLSSIQII